MNEDQSDKLLANLARGESEHEAWKDTNAELREIGYADAWNDPRLSRLHAAIVVWGEQLAALRREQSPKEIDQAMATARHTVDRAAEGAKHLRPKGEGT